MMKKAVLKIRLVKLWKDNGIEIYKDMMPSHWDYFETSASDLSEDVPEGFTVICYWKPGDSEGNYFHVEARRYGESKCVLLGKTLASVLDPIDFEILKLTTIALNWTRPKTCILED
jgi:hypothetical protein